MALNQVTGSVTPWVAYRPEIGFVINHSVPMGDSASVFDPNAYAGVYYSKMYDHTCHSKLFSEQYIFINSKIFQYNQSNV